MTEFVSPEFASPEFAPEFVYVRTGIEHPGIGTVVLSRPPDNTLTRQAYREFVAAAQEVSRRDDIAAVIIFGGHEIFCAGDDPTELCTLVGAEVETTVRARADAVRAVAAIGKPTVAAVTGYALGAGLSLALAADRRVSGDNARFGATEILSGLIPDSDGLAFLARGAGLSRAKDLVYSGRFCDAEEALASGLVDELVAPDTVYDAALAWAHRFVDTSPSALTAAKAGFDEVFTLGPAERSAVQSRRFVELFTAGDSLRRQR